MRGMDNLNLALFFEGTGQGVRGKRTNVSLVYESCVEDETQRRHLETGPGARVGTLLLGRATGVGWRQIFARARRWYEAQAAARPSGAPPTRVFLFGFSRGALLARHFAAWLDKLGVAVEYLGLWDTVDATPGLAVSESCPANVRFARHAVAEHEARRFYAYVPLRGAQVEEELFPGVHSDVGGLYEDDHALADAARAWVAAPAAARGLRFRPETDFSEVRVPSTAVRHDSLRLVSNLFGLLRPAKRLFSPSTRRHAALSPEPSQRLAQPRRPDEEPTEAHVPRGASSAATAGELAHDHADGTTDRRAEMRSAGMPVRAVTARR